jgi:hypothetical protein
MAAVAARAEAVRKDLRVRVGSGLGGMGGL